MTWIFPGNLTDTTMFSMAFSPLRPWLFYLCEKQISGTFLRQRNGPHSTFPFKQSHDEGRCPEQGNPCPPLNTLA
ncbi:hypothetical protein HMPREF3038_02912 [Akkermansia sp. KLE1797]|nr:hypothetical protein HMPREF3038_02912 [Akkermansia sp. KLE1797]KXU52621.1 hypothetical protein HMPREF3039_03143 [Akkermansia sp. KLE1798]KZA04051.1 hypothetical protein HMPREF1326_02246 [Akkermansia sp. KLE1605]